jgi:hypothetical protein
MQDEHGTRVCPEARCMFQTILPNTKYCPTHGWNLLPAERCRHCLTHLYVAARFCHACGREVHTGQAVA